MNTYVYPLYYLDNGELFIDHVPAYGLTEARERIMRETLTSDDDVIVDWDEFLTYMAKEHEVIIGDVYNIDEF